MQPGRGHMVECRDAVVDVVDHVHVLGAADGVEGIGIDINGRIAVVVVVIDCGGTRRRRGERREWRKVGGGRGAGARWRRGVGRLVGRLLLRGVVVTVIVVVVVGRMVVMVIVTVIAILRRAVDVLGLAARACVLVVLTVLRT